MTGRAIGAESSFPKSLETRDEQYSSYLERKYLPGRRQYLHWVFYPKLLRYFKTADPIVDLGCGAGEFLNYCRRKSREVVGVDSNEAFVKRCQANGFKVHLDSICELKSLGNREFKYAICDNVLEHLALPELQGFFDRIDALLSPSGTLICIVPGRRGFKCDPTHKTFVTLEVLTSLLTGKTLQVKKKFLHPLNLGFVDRFFYLNMQVFEISTPTSKKLNVLY